MGRLQISKGPYFLTPAQQTSRKRPCVIQALPENAPCKPLADTRVFLPRQTKQTGGIAGACLSLRLKGAAKTIFSCKGNLFYLEIAAICLTTCA